MKKLLFTAIAAAGAAFGLQAADAGFFSGSDFEDSALPSGVAWTLPTDESRTLAIGDNNGDTYTGDVPDQWINSDQTKFLSVKTTFGKPINLNVVKDSAAASQAMADGIYFDSLVKFTACDETPTTDYSNAKIVVWAQEDEAAGKTNLYVRALDAAGQPANFKCNEIGTLGAWHRLTIKAIADIGKLGGADSKPGFVVFVDGSAINYLDDQIALTDLNDNAAKFHEFKQLFVSLDQTSTDKLNVSSVGFDGQGSLDEVTLTSTAPTFAKDFEFFTVSGDSNVTSFKANGVDSNNGVVQLTWTGAGMEVTISDMVFADGYMFDKLGIETGVTAAGNVFTVNAANKNGTVDAKAAAASFNGTTYATVAEAVDAANDITEAGEYTLKLFGAASDITLENSTENVKLIIDLAGQTISASENAYAIVISGSDAMITNSTAEVGTVNNGEEGSVMVSEGALLITAGKYEGAIANEATLAITDGMFKVKPDDQYAPEGKVFALDADSGYYVVSEAPYAGPEQDAQGNFLIKTEQDLRWVSDHFADFQNATLIQQNDIALTEVWNGIGRYGKDDVANATKFAADAFQGVYDGQNYSITGIKLKSDFAQGTATNKYIGFFFSTYNATIKNVKFGIANYGWDNGKSIAQDVGAGLVVGTTKNSMFTNIVTLAGTGATGEFYGTHALSGFAGFTAYTNTFVDCVNNLDISEARSSGGKVGGFSACSQNAPLLTFIRCVNNGNITSVAPQAAGGVAAFAAYCQGKANFQDCVNNGNVQQAEFASDGSASPNKNYVFTNLGGNKGKGNLVTIDGTSVDFNFATGPVDNLYTFVKDADVALNGSYKVVNAAATYAFAGPGSITFDKTLAPSFAPTAPAGYQVTNEGNVYTCAAIPVSSVTISGEKEVKVGETITLTATVLPADALDKTVTWKSSDDSLATVTDAGVVTGVAAGKVTITATAGGVDGTYEVEVKTAGGWDPTSTDTVNTVLGDKAPAALSGVSFGQLSTWAGNAGNLKFEDVKTAEDINVEAFLFNVDNDGTGVAAEKAAFAFTAITPGETPEIRTTNLAGDAYNGTVTVKAFEDAACTTEVTDPTGAETELFYQATLEPTPAPVED